MIGWLERWALRRADRREADALVHIERMLVEIDEGRMSAEAAFGGPAVKLFVACLYEWYQKNGGENFATCEITHSKTGERFEFTMRRAHGKTPGHVLGELRYKVSKLVALLDRAREISAGDLMAVGHDVESESRTQAMTGLREWIAELDAAIAEASACS